MEEFATLTAEEDSIDLPPGFRFHPTDEEIITHYLIKKATNNMFMARAIGDVDLNKCEPWDLPKRAKMGETQWYFFCQRDRKYPTGMRTNRATQAGYWKATGKDKEIYKGKGNLIGMKKTLVFYKGRAPKGEKTNWVMHEYRLEGDSSLYNLPKPTKEEWSVCRVFHKNIGTKRDSNPSQQRLSSHSDGYMGSSSTLSLPPLVEPPAATNMIRTSFSFPDKGEIFKETSSSLENVPFGLYGINYTGIQESQQGLKNQPTVSNHYQAIPLNSFQRSTLSTNVPFSSRVVSLHQGPDIQGYLNQNRNNVNLSFQNNESSFGHQEMMRELGSASWVSTSKNQCKVEQFSNQSGMVTVSQDTGLSDIYTDNSSVISKPEPSHGEFDGLSVNTSSNDSMFDWLWPYGINVED